MSRRKITRKLEQMPMRMKMIFVAIAFIIMLILYFGLNVLSNSIYGVGITDITSVFVNVFFQLGFIIIFGISLVLIVGIVIGELSARLVILSLSVLSTLLISFILLLGGI